MRRLTLPALSLILLAACQSGVAPLTDEDITALNELRAAYAAGVLANDCQATAAVMAEDAVALAPDTPMVEGRATIRAACEAEEPEAAAQDVTMTSLEVDGYGDLAFDRGTWSQTYVTEGAAEPLTVTGKYVVIARKQADGAWLWTVGIYNFDAPLPQPEQP